MKSKPKRPVGWSPRTSKETILGTPEIANIAIRFNPDMDSRLNNSIGDTPTNYKTQWLTAQGVSVHALLCPWPIGATRVKFDGDYFDPDPSGENALTFVCFDREEPIDVCAWSPKTRKLATYLGRAAFLGDEDDLFNPATWFGGSELRIHASPIEWLKGDREGVVILDEAKAGPYLAQCQSVFCAYPVLAARVRKIIRPKPILKIHTERKVANG